MKKCLPLLVLGFFLFAFHAHAAITFDAATSTTGTTVSSLNKSITIGAGTNEALLIQVAGRCAVTGITVGGNSATFIASTTNAQDSTYQYYYLGLPTGSVSVTSTCSSANNAVMGLASFFGVNQTTPLDTSVKVNGNNIPPSNTITTTVQNDLLIDAISYQTETSTPSTGQTQIAMNYGGSCPACEGLMSSYKIVTSTQSYTMSWATNSAVWSDIVAAFEPAVTLPPSITSFSASPTTVTSSFPSVLTWNITNASSVTITPGSFSTSTLIGSTTVNPTSTINYLLTATNPGGSTTSTATVTVRYGVPTTPTGLSAISTSNDILFSWTSSTDSTGPGLAGYNIFRCVGSCTPMTRIATTSNPSYNDGGLATSTTYTYAVSAYDILNNLSATSTNASATTGPAGVNIRSLSYQRYAWNNTIGWIDFFGPQTVVVTNSQFTGYASSSAGYISFDCATSPRGNVCGTSRYGVSNDGSGNLSGWAWNDVYGWISFCGNASGGSIWNGSNWVCPSSPTYQVIINPLTGIFSGWAWSSAIGWISFNCSNTGTCGTSNYYVQTTWTGTVGSSAMTGTLDSQTFDTGVASGSQINSITWQGLLPASTSIGFQIAVSNATSGPWNYAGPDGSASTTYTGLAGIPITLNNYPILNGRYFRYRVILTSDSAQTVTPRVTDIVVNWSP